MLPIILAINNENDRRFVEDIYIKYRKKIYCVAFNILKKEDMAEECVHDVINIVINKVINNLERFKLSDKNHFINLLVKCTRNAAINIYNREKKRRSFEVSMYINLNSHDFDEEETEIEIADDAENFDDILITEENKKRLSELISELDVIYQDVLYLRYQMWMSNSEIAKLLGVSENVVKVRLHRAKAILLKTRRDELNELRKK